eukprot:1158208-Pelagomonas_calceolata.AAC.33
MLTTNTCLLDDFAHSGKLDDPRLHILPEGRAVAIGGHATQGHLHDGVCTGITGGLPGGVCNEVHVRSCARRCAQPFPQLTCPPPASHLASLTGQLRQRPS